MTNILKDLRAADTPAPLFTWRGRDIYPVWGAEGEDDDTGSADSDSGSEDDEDASTDGTDAARTGTVSQEDFEKIKNQLRASDKRNADLDKRLKAIDDSKKDELTKATERVTELEAQQAKDSKEIASLRLQNAFLSANTGITWHDPGDALALAERKGYLDEVVGEDGTVDNAKLTAKLKEMAKASPHLVKSGKEDTPGTSGGGSSNGSASTGGKVGSKGSGGGKGSGPDLSRYSRHLNR